MGSIYLCQKLKQHLVFSHWTDLSSTRNQSVIWLNSDWNFCASFSASVSNNNFNNTDRRESRFRLFMLRSYFVAFHSFSLMAQHATPRNFISLICVTKFWAANWLMWCFLLISRWNTNDLGTFRDHPWAPTQVRTQTKATTRSDAIIGIAKWSTSIGRRRRKTRQEMQLHHHRRTIPSIDRSQITWKPASMVSRRKEGHDHRRDRQTASRAFMWDSKWDYKVFRKVDCKIKFNWIGT